MRLPTPYTVRVPRNIGFPLDMLRYDEAYPATTLDALMIDRLIRGDDAEIPLLPLQVDVRLFSRSAFAPNVDRWNSFLIVVIPDREED